MFWKAFNKICTSGNNKGFTIIDTLVTLVIFSSGILTVGAMQMNSLSVNVSAQKRVQALTLARERMENLMALPYDHKSLTAGSYFFAADRDGMDNNGNGVIGEPDETGNFTFSWTITEVDLDEDGLVDAKNVQVVACWKDRGDSRRSSIKMVKQNV